MPPAPSTVRCAERIAIGDAPRLARRAAGRPPQGGGRGGPTDDCYRGGDPGYYNEIFVDGHDPRRSGRRRRNFWRSTDGGKTWATVPMPGVHVDHHEIVFDPPIGITSSSATTAASTRPTTA